MDKIIDDSGPGNLYRYIAFIGIILFITPVFEEKSLLEIELKTIDMRAKVSAQENVANALNNEIVQLVLYSW